MEARSIDSAFKKADRILEIKENESGTGEMEGQKVALRRGGVLELEPIIVPLVSGADIFDETESGVRADEIQARVITKDRRRSMVDYEKKNGFPPVLDVFLGDDFDTL